MKTLFLPFCIAICFLAISSNAAYAQRYGNGYSGNIGSGYNNGFSGANNLLGNLGGGNYAGTSQANIDHTILNGNREMLRNDIDYEDYVLRKRSAFVQQMSQIDQAEEQLRAYAEQRLKTLAKLSNKKSGTLNSAQQAEAHDLMNWLKKDAEQRANNIAYLKRQDHAVAALEQDQIVSFKNQRNALHNLFEDNLAVQSQYKWNKQLQTAGLHQIQSNNGAVSWGRPPGDGRLGGYGNYGGYNNRRWGY